VEYCVDLFVPLDVGSGVLLALNSLSLEAPPPLPLPPAELQNYLEQESDQDLSECICLLWVGARTCGIGALAAFLKHEHSLGHYICSHMERYALVPAYLSSVQGGYSKPGTSDGRLARRNSKFLFTHQGWIAARGPNRINSRNIYKNNYFFCTCPV